MTQNQNVSNDADDLGGIPQENVQTSHDPTESDGEQAERQRIEWKQGQEDTDLV